MSAVLFDFGGTLDTDGVHWSEKFWELYERFGVEVDKPSFEQAFVQAEGLLSGSADLTKATMYRTLHRQLTLQFAILRLDGESSLLKQMVETAYREVAGEIGRASRLLDALRARYALAVVSNFYGNLQVVCNEFNIARYFSAIIDSAVVGVRKPDPEIFRLAVERLGETPDRCTVVGDSYERDIVPAKQLGISTIWLRGRSWANPAATAAADHIISTLEGARDILLHPAESGRPAS